MTTDRTGAGDAEAMSGWARLLHDIVERRLHPAGGVDLVAPSWDATFDTAFSLVMQEMLASQLRALSPEQFVATCRALGRRDDLLAALDPLIAERARDAERDRALVLVQRDCAVAGRLLLSRLTADETLDLGLFDPARPDLAAWRHRDDTGRRPLVRILRVRLDDPAAGTGRIVNDTWHGAVWTHALRTPPIPAMTAVRLGTALPDGDFLPAELTLRAPVTLVGAQARTWSAPGLLGYARTADGRTLLDPPT